MWEGVEGAGGSINFCKEKYMEEGYKKCPKCDGNGKHEYVYYQIGAILDNLASLKNGKAIDHFELLGTTIKNYMPFLQRHRKSRLD